MERMMYGRSQAAKRLGCKSPNLMRDWGKRLPKPDARTASGAPLWDAGKFETWMRKEGHEPVEDSARHGDTGLA